MSRTKLAYAIHGSFAKRANAAGASRLQKALMASGLMGTAGLGVKAHSLANQLAESGAALGAAESKNLGLGAQVAALTNNLGVKGNLLQSAMSANAKNIEGINLLNKAVRDLTSTNQAQSSQIASQLKQIENMGINTDKLMAQVKGFQEILKNTRAESGGFDSNAKTWGEAASDFLGKFIGHAQ